MKAKKIMYGVIASFMAVSFLTFVPLSLTQTENGVGIDTQQAEAANSWEYVKTSKKNTKFNDITFGATLAAISSALGYVIPASAPASAFANYVVDHNLKTAYFVDKEYVRMAGATMQTKHVITMYTDSSYSKKAGTKTLITNDSGGPMSLNEEK